MPLACKISENPGHGDNHKWPRDFPSSPLENCWRRQKWPGGCGLKPPNWRTDVISSSPYPFLLFPPSLLKSNYFIEPLRMLYKSWLKFSSKVTLPRLESTGHPGIDTEGLLVPWSFTALMLDTPFSCTCLHPSVVALSALCHYCFVIAWCLYHLVLLQNDGNKTGWE